jgi:hypothetical protein
MCSSKAGRLLAKSMFETIPIKPVAKQHQSLKYRNWRGLLFCAVNKNLVEGIIVRTKHLYSKYSTYYFGIGVLYCVYLKSRFNL